MLKNLLWIVILVFIGTSTGFSQNKKTKHQYNGEKLITDLVKSRDLSGIFGDDGSMLFSYKPELERILSLRSRGFPLLIRHLNDKRVMPYLSYNVSNFNEPVTVGAVCLDILIRISHATPDLYDMKCEAQDHDTPSECLKPKYLGTHKVQNWQSAYRRHLLKFDRGYYGFKA